MNNKGNDDSKKILWLIIFILFVMISVTSTTYAYLAFTASNNSVVVGKVGDPNLNLTVSRQIPSSNNGAMVPQLESALGTALSSQYNCVDGNGNVVCHVYKIEVKNNGDASLNVNGSVSFTFSGGMPNLKYKLMANSSTLGDEPSRYAKNEEGPLIKNLSLPVNVTRTYYMVVWLDETGSTQSDNGTYRATVKFDSAQFGGGLTSTIVNYMDSFVSAEDSSYFHHQDYKNSIKNISFVDYIDTSNAVETWDMSSFNNGSIMAWVENNTTSGYYNLYIGSNDIIYSKDMQFFFYGMEYVDSIDLSNLDTSYVTNMSYMFGTVGFYSTAFTLDLGENFDTSNVTDMSGMFGGVGYNSPMFTLDLGDKFDTSSVIDMDNLFERTGLNSTVFTLNLGNRFDTSNVTDMHKMFYKTGYSNTNFSINFGDKFNTSKVFDTREMFYQTGYLNNNFELDLSQFTFDNVTDYSDMFYMKATQKIYVKNQNDKTWLVDKVFNGVTNSNVIVVS